MAGLHLPNDVLWERDTDTLKADPDCADCGGGGLMPSGVDYFGAREYVGCDCLMYVAPANRSIGNEVMPGLFTGTSPIFEALAAERNFSRSNLPSVRNRPRHRKTKWAEFAEAMDSATRSLTRVVQDRWDAVSRVACKPLEQDDLTLEA